jgi:hypothetical protein
MKRVLIITYYWPPMGGSGVQRWVKFSKYLPSFGWQPVIYTPENPEISLVDKTLLNDIPKEAEIIKRHITEPYGIYRKVMGIKSVKGTEVNPIHGGPKTFKEKVSLFIRGNFFIPDPRVMWRRPSVRFLKKYLKDHPVDVIVTTGPPQSMHLIGLDLHKATGIPWIVDFRDPWTKMYYYKHLELLKRSDRIQHSMEKEVLDNATSIIAVSPDVQKDFQAMTQTPVELITNGFDENDFDKNFERDENFNVTHTGLFASAGNPEVLWRVLGDKCATNEEFRRALKIRLVGKTDKEILDSIESNGMKGNLMDFGYRNHETAIKEQHNASILILPLRKEPEYGAALPGKLFEYVASRRPILGIGQPDGAMARILSDTKSGVVFDWNDDKNIKAWVDMCWDEFTNDELKDNESDISRYSRRSLTKNLVELMESIINK